MARALRALCGWSPAPARQRSGRAPDDRCGHRYARERERRGAAREIAEMARACAFGSMSEKAWVNASENSLTTVGNKSRMEMFALENSR